MHIFYAVNILIFAVKMPPLIQVQGNVYGNHILISVAKLGHNFGFSQILTS